MRALLTENGGNKHHIPRMKPSSLDHSVLSRKLVCIYSVYLRCRWYRVLDAIVSTIDWRADAPGNYFPVVSLEANET